MTVIVRELAWADGQTLEALDRPERERYERLAEAVEHLLDADDFHEGCHGYDELQAAVERGRRDGSARAYVRVLEGLRRMRAENSGRWNDGTLYDVERRVLALHNDVAEARAA